VTKPRQPRLLVFLIRRNSRIRSLLVRRAGYQRALSITRCLPIQPFEPKLGPDRLDRVDLKTHSDRRKLSSEKPTFHQAPAQGAFYVSPS
jgi:hypothetical protein